MKQENFNFDKAVLERSNDVPVLVDYWSPTCGPCLFLGPILEKLAGQAAGSWELVKINTMEHNDLAMAHGIYSIPHVKLFSKGKLVSEFVGALPEGTLVKWLDEFIPTEAKEELATIRERLNGDDREKALQDLREFITAHPDLDMARLVLASEIVFDTPDEAVKLVEPVQKGALLWDASENVRILAELVGYKDASGSEAGKKVEEAAAALKKQDYEAALAGLVDATETDKELSGQLPQRGTIALFRMFGAQHPLTLKYRRRFEQARY